MIPKALPCRQSHSVFPDICSTFPFGVAGKGSGMEKRPNRPMRPHGLGGEQSVRSPPASVRHICGRLSPLCSLRSSALRPTSARSPHCVLLSLARSKPENNQSRCTLSALILPPPPSPNRPFPDYLYWWGLHMKRDHPLYRNEGEGSGHISSAVHRCPSHSGQNE